MEKIIRDYAIIYIDKNGESLNCDNYTPDEIINDYYNNPGFLQWNYYLIIHKELIENLNLCTKIESDDKYTRKFVMCSDEIDIFINNLFPIFKKDNEYSKIKLIKGNSYIDSERKSLSFKKTHEDFKRLESWYRNECLNFALNQMDLLRMKLIKEKQNYIFYTHISNEYFLAKQKFKLFDFDN